MHSVQLNYSYGTAAEVLCSSSVRCDCTPIGFVLIYFKYTNNTLARHACSGLSGHFFQHGSVITLPHNHRIWHQPWLLWDRVLAHVIRDRLRSS